MAAKIVVDKLVLGMCQTNCYMLHRDGDARTVVVDPADKGQEIFNHLTQKGLKVEGVILTHGHFDHILGCKDLINAVNASKEGEKALVHACEKEKNVLNDPRLNLSSSFGKACTVDADVYLKDGEEFTLAGITFRVIWTPGHTEGSCCYYCEPDGTVMDEVEEDDMDCTVDCLISLLREKLGDHFNDVMRRELSDKRNEMRRRRR